MKDILYLFLLDVTLGAMAGKSEAEIAELQTASDKAVQLPISNAPVEAPKPVHKQVSLELSK
jgi:hypothetical protein